MLILGPLSQHQQRATTDLRGEVLLSPSGRPPSNGISIYFSLRSLIAPHPAVGREPRHPTSPHLNSTSTLPSCENLTRARRAESTPRCAGFLLLLLLAILLSPATFAMFRTPVNRTTSWQSRRVLVRCSRREKPNHCKIHPLPTCSERSGAGLSSQSPKREKEEAM